MGEPLTKYVGRATDLRDKLAAAGFEVKDEEVVLSILAGLPKEYETVVAVLELSDATLKLDDLLPKLLQAEQRMPRGEKGPEAAYFSRRMGQDWKAKSGASGAGSAGRKETRECFYCGKRGHLKADCRKKKADELRAQRDRGQGGGWAHAVAMAASTTGNTQEWVLDSGASHHITFQRDLLQDARPCRKDISIMFANGERGAAESVGDVLIKTTEDVALKLQHVLYVPSAAANLFSISSATAGGATFQFSSTGCVIRHSGRHVATAARASNGVYRIHAQQVAPAALAARVLPKETPELWHRRFGHLGYDNLAKLVQGDMVHGIHVPANDFKGRKADVCEPCIMAKHHKAPFPTAGSKPEEGADMADKARALLGLVHMDLCGPLPVTSLGGSKYVATFLDDYSKLSIVRPIATKAEVASVVREVIELLETQSGKRCRAIRTDNATEYVNKELATYLKAKGIIHQTTVPYNPEQNGAAERLNRTLMERTRAMLSDAGLPSDLWAEAVVTANYIRCRSPAANKAKTPWELFFGNKPDVSMLRTFGATAYAYVPKEKRHKLDDRSLRGVMVGYGAHTKGYRILLEDRTIATSRDVIFDERVEATGHPEEKETQPSGDGVVHPDAEPASPRMAPPPAPPAADVLHEEPAASSGTRYPSRERRAPREWWKEQATAMGATVFEPSTFEEAMASDNAEQWRHAMDEEMASLRANQTWTLEEVPPGVDPIPVKWVYKLKMDANGTVQRFKARLVAKGYKQREGIDFDEVFAPVSKYATLRTLLAIAAAEDMELHQLDIKTAFLNGEIEEDIFLQQPPGFKEGPGNHACHLRRALYGLRQAPRQWHARLKEELEVCGFCESAADPGLFIHQGKTGTVYLLVYVDDILIAAKDISAVEWAKDKVKGAFDARDLAEAKLYLNMTIERDRARSTLKLGQERMVTQLLAKYGLEEAKTKAVPLDASIKLIKDDGEPLNQDKYAYSQLVGSLMYLAVCTRPDIAQAVGALAKYMAAPTTTHWTAAIGVLRYLAGTKDHGICFGGGGASSKLTGYCDADFAGDPDTRRSTTGYVFILNGGAISWSSRRQQTVAASTTEAEYMAAAAATKEALWLRKLMGDLHKGVNTVIIKADNQGAIKLLRNPISSLRSKHSDVIYHFAWERVARKEVAFEYINTEHMIADVLTKAVGTAKHSMCCNGMGVNNVV